MIPSISKFRQTESCVFAPLGSETAILNTEKGVYFGLNESGTLVWEFLGKSRSVDEICTLVLAEYEVDPAICENDVQALLASLLEHGLITPDDATQ